MIDEAMPEWLRLMNYLRRFDPPQIRALAEKAGNFDMVTGEGDCTLEAEVADHPGAEVLRPTRDVREAEPDDGNSVFLLSERHLDLMSPTHLLRGMICMPGAAFLWLTAWVCWNSTFHFLQDVLAGKHSLGLWLMDPVFVGVSGFFTWLFWHAFVSFDWFHYRANPIRFDRERRMVHVWRSRRAGGCFSVPWDDTLFLVRGGKDSEGYPRALSTTFFSIDPETRRIKRRIAVGKLYHDVTKADAFYEYIRRFMEQGRSAVPAPRRPALMTPSLAYSFNAWFKFTDIAEQRRKGEWTVVDWGVTLLLAPLHLLLALSHFIAMITSRTPKWPAEMG